MSDETPEVPAPSAEEPVTAAPVEEPTTPGADAPAVSAEAPAEPPAAPPTEAAEPATVADEAPTEAAPVEAATTTAGAPTEVAAPAAAAAVAPAAPAAAPPERGRGVFVPVWVAVVVGVLVIAGLGFLIGWIAAPGDDSSPSNAAATLPNGQNVPTLPGNGSIPGLPGNNNGNGSDGSGSNGNGNGSGSTPTQSNAYMGITLESATDGGGGARVNSVVSGSPADKAGLQEGDVITKVNGNPVSSALDVVRVVRQSDPGDSVTITYTRDGSTKDVKVTLGTTPTRQSAS